MLVHKITLGLHEVEVQKVNFPYLNNEQSLLFNTTLRLKQIFIFLYY